MAPSKSSLTSKGAAVRWAVIRDGVVENVIEWDGETTWEPEPGAAIVADEDGLAQPGYLYDGVSFTAPED